MSVDRSRGDGRPYGGMRRQLKRIAATFVVSAAISTGCDLAAQESAAARYDCGWAAPATALRCAPAEDAIAGLAAASEAHELASHFGPDDTTWSRMQAALRRARTELDPDRLSARERIFAQNAALHIAIVAANHAVGGETAPNRQLVREAAALIAWLALPADRLGPVEADAELAQWLGPPSGVQELRAGDDAFVFHEAVHFHTRAFRLVRVGRRRFIFSQLVAIDDQWQPHVTSVIGDMEMRNEDGQETAACIADFDAAWSRCGAPAGLRALDRLPISHLGGYVRVDETGRANCAQCHLGGQVLGRTIRDLPAGELAADLAQRRARLLAALEQFLAPLRSAATAAPE